MGKQDPRGPRFVSPTSRNCQGPPNTCAREPRPGGDGRPQPEPVPPPAGFEKKASVLLLKMRCFMTQLNTCS